MLGRLLHALARAWRWLGDDSMDRRARESLIATENKNRDLRGPGRPPYSSR
jgi:hypothetical protein